MKRQIIISSLLVLTATGAAGCSLPAPGYAGTMTWGAPLAHSAGHYPHLVVEDDTTGGWPVQQAVNSWEVPVTYGRCLPAVSCVRITDLVTLGGNRVGLTSRPVSSGPETITIQLAENPKMNALEALQDVTHEFGHALGLGHDEIGVMHAGITGAYLKPNAAELARVRSLYLN